MTHEGHTRAYVGQTVDVKRASLRRVRNAKQCPRRLHQFLTAHEVPDSAIEVLALEIVNACDAHESEQLWTVAARAGYPEGFNGFGVYGHPGARGQLYGKM